MDIVVCPSTNEIQQLLSGHLESELAARLTDHVQVCSNCMLAIQNLRPNRPEAVAFPPVADHTLASAAGEDSQLRKLLASKAGANQLPFLSPPAGPDELGRLAQYRVLKVLGDGGMGIVLLAEDMLLGRAVALKVIKSEFSSDADIRQRFLREARALANVKSDYVVTIHQVGQHNDNCFIAMELLEGRPLSKLLEKEGRPALGDALRIAGQVARALAAVHARGFVHRDVKPENIWIEAESGRAKLLDFGLVRPDKDNVKLTTSGIIMGTPAYMSPEQAKADVVDERSDLFSLGCLLYEMTTGSRPFVGSTVMATLWALAMDTPAPPSQVNSAIPNALDDLILRLLAKQPEDRPKSAREVIAELETIQVANQANPAAAAAQPPSTSGWLRSDAAQTASRSGDISSSPGLTASQSVRTREAERRQVTVLVCSCDVFESDDYLGRLEVEEQARILGAFQECCGQAVLESKGTIVQCNEESLIACFGYPIAYEDSAHLATSAALAVLKGLTALGTQVHGPQIEFNPRLGLHTGPAIVETKGSDVLLVGEARSVAVRLKDLVAAGQAVCTESTRRVLRGKFHLTSLGQQKIKGVEQPVDLYQIMGLVDPLVSGEAAQPVELTPLTGRDLELSLLKDRWEQAQEGAGQVVLLIGEAGLGKSRLVNSIKEHVLGTAKSGIDSSSSRYWPGGITGSSPGTPTPQLGSPVIEWQCFSHFSNTGLHPAINFFERFLRFRSEDTQPERFQRLLDHLESCGLVTPEVVPLFASLLSLPSDSRFPSLALPPVREREEMFRALKDWLRACSEKQPVLFIVEDLHWLDASTLEFLGQILAEDQRDRILTVLTFRPDFHTPWPARPHQTSLALNRLTKRQVSELMQKKMGRQLPELVIDKIYGRSEGIPLFVEEFTKVVQESGMLEQATESGTRIKALMSREIPASLQDLVMSRLDRMEGDRELAQLAATIGREFSYELLSSIVGIDQEMLDAELAKLVRAEILYQKGRPPQSSYIFKHALLEDALYNALVKDKRRHFHGTIAETLEARFPQTVATQPELIAHHLSEAGLTERSIGYWRSAGLRSQELFANVEAIGHFTKGLELLNTLPESPERDVNELLLLNSLGSAYQAARGYAAPEVGPTFARARKLCEKAGQTSQLFEVMWGNWTWHLVRGDLELCMSLADELMALAQEAEDPGMIMEAYVAPAVTLFYRGDFAGCRKHCDRAIASYENKEQCAIWCARLGQDSAVVLRCYLSLALWHLGFPEQAISTNEQMLALARQLGHPFSLAHGLHFTGWLYKCLRSADQLRAAALEEIAIATSQGFALWHSTGTFFNGAGILLQGDLEEALRLLAEGMHSFHAIAANLTLPAQLAVLAEAFTMAGQFEEAGRILDRGLELAHKNDDRSHEPELHRLKGDLALARSDDQSTAEECFKRAIEIARKQSSLAWELRSTISLARLRQRQRRQGEAAGVLSAIYGAYSEGLATHDLMNARDLLNSLAEKR